MIIAIVVSILLTWLLGAGVILALRYFGWEVDSWYGLPRTAAIVSLVVCGLSLVGAALFAASRQPAWASRALSLAVAAAASVGGLWLAGATANLMAFFGLIAQIDKKP